MKTIKTVQKLVERAQRNGGAVLNREGVEVYRIDHTTKDRASLYHYETLTCEIDLDNREITYLYGESVSDSDSIGTFLECFGLSVWFGYRPVNGGFYASIAGQEFFLDDFSETELAKKVMENLNKTIDK